MAHDTTLLSDVERERVLASLREACIDGRLTLEEFSRRTETALTARTRGELAPVSSDLAAAPPSLPSRRSATRRMLALMGSDKQTGRWRIAAQSTAIAVMGECVLDLRRAEVESAEVQIDAYALMGEVKVIVPEGVRG